MNPALSSYNDKSLESYCPTSRLLSTVNNALKNADASPTKIPTTCCFWSSAMKYTPTITRTEKSNSIFENGFFKISGSNKAVNKVIDDKQIIATDTDASLIDA